MTADDERLWFDDAVWARAVYRRATYRPLSLAASAAIIGPPRDLTALAAARRARRAYVDALWAVVHPA